MKRRRLKIASVLVILNMVYEMAFPLAAHALTGGPSQPEVHGFEPVGTNQMVDLFSGDFTYNIPLLDVGGYPVNIAYHSGEGMESEASWVGLGWSLTPGAINRAMRGLPDDFRGEKVKTERNIKANTTVGLDVRVPIEVFGAEFPDIERYTGIGVSVGVYHNSYVGVGYKAGLDGLKSQFGPIEIGANIGVDTRQGTDVFLSMAFRGKLAGIKDQSLFGKLRSTGKISYGANAGIGISSGYGIKSLSFGASANTPGIKKAMGNLRQNANIPVNYSTYFPSVGPEMRNMGLKFDLALGPELPFTHIQGEYSGYFSQQWLKEKESDVPSYGYLYTQHASNDEDSKDQLDFNREMDHAYEFGSDNINLSQLTYDVFSISGQGTGGMFRPHRNDFPIVGDAVKHDGLGKQTLNVINDAAVGLEIGTGTTLKFGGNVQLAGEKTRGVFGCVKAAVPQSYKTKLAPLIKAMVMFFTKTPLCSWEAKWRQLMKIYLKTVADTMQ